ncbi:PREDICTED: protein PRRC2C-like isoform X4 [Populus euphratica]|uniref:Protein PRRC2C-like isoform X4 n=1 Tax=Populus euphratica TaxID=75702 RepID=A0AAJ6XQ21_POPEU|nr:PREDICTED: protein PRRC2C-like isoform X4 [Populus euphratica]
MSSQKFIHALLDFSDGYGTGGELNNGLVNGQMPVDEYSAQPQEHGANMFPQSAPVNHEHFQSANTQINHNQTAQPDAYLFQFGTAPSDAMKHGLVNVPLPHLLDQPQGAIYTLNPSMSAQMNLSPLDKPGSSQSSNISNADLEKRLRKQESDRKSRAKKEQMRRENEERLVKVTEENNELRKDNASLKEGEAEMKRKLATFVQKVSHLEKEVSRLNNKLKGQNTKVDVLSEKLVASSEATDPVEENKRLKRKNELLMTQLNNPDIMQTVELVEEIEKWKRKAKRLQIINEALCDKMNNDEHE